MAAVIPNVAELRIAELLTEQSLQVRLFKNDFTPDEDTEFDDLEEATFNGYAPVQTAETWSPPVTNIDGKASTTTGNCTFTAADPVDEEIIYGYYVTPTGGPAGHILGVERFAAPKTIDTPGQFINLVLTLTAVED